MANGCKTAARLVVFAAAVVGEAAVVEIAVADCWSD